ncbi:MAG: SDR family oxidoreductase [Pirellulaceae bacterium]|nr:SDR family oxidoreductase [Pirellulaceae bacterium]
MPLYSADDAGEVKLVGRTAVVTGSSRGIGRAIALGLAQAGADVLVHANTSAAAGEEVARSVRLAGRRGELRLADLSDAQQRAALVDAAWRWAERIDIWVNNAGADVLTGEAAGWDFERKLNRLWQVDVAATIDLARRVGQRMSAQSPWAATQAGEFPAAQVPVILNMGWDQAEQGMEGDSGELFAATKGAIMAFSRSLARSLAPRVRVNCLAPGWIQTAWGAEAPEYWQRRAAGESLLARWGTADDVARAACFLASPAAAFINGQVLAINGGFRHAGEPSR